MPFSWLINRNIFKEVTMRNIRITITAEKQPNVVITTKWQQRKKTPYEKLRHLLKNNGGEVK